MPVPLAPLPTVPDPTLLEPADLAHQLRVDVATGLSAAQVRKRLTDNGPNVFASEPSPSQWSRLLAQFQDPLVYLLLAAVLVTLAAWALEGRHGWPVDALVILAIVSLNAFMGYAQDARSQRAAAALARLAVVNVTVRRDGIACAVAGPDLVPGDILLLSEGDRVGADARLVQANTLLVQQASLTGESEAVPKDVATLKGPVALAERTNMVFKGTAVVQGTGLAIVTATGMQTEMGAVAHLLAATPEVATPLQKEIRAMSRRLGWAVLLIATIVVVTLWWVTDIRTGADAVAVLLLGVSLAVAAVPEGLPAILSLVLALGVQRMARHHAIVKKISSVETLGSASVICTDKTGTLTRSEMTIQRIVTASGDVRVDGVGYQPVGQLHLSGALLPAGDVFDEVLVVLGGGSEAGNAALRQADGGSWAIQGDPTEAAFLVAERKQGTAERRARRFARIAEIPFTSDRKRMSVVVTDQEHGGAQVLISKGAPDVLLPHCTQLRVGRQCVPLTQALRSRVLADLHALSGDALRTLGVAYRPLAAGEDAQAGSGLEQGLVYAGTVGMMDPPRAEVRPAIAEAQRAGIRIVMITGDHPRTAARIAADLGIQAADARVLTGPDMDALDTAGLAAAVRLSAVFARVAPVHKLRIVDALQANGDVVAMTGDGVNDAPALKAADIGIAMGITGTEVTKQAGKMILADDNFATIVTAVREGRGILNNIRKFLRYLLSSNMGEVLTVFLGVLGAHALGLTDGSGTVVLPLLATQILWINLVTDSTPALAMGVDPQSDDVMARPPRAHGERVIDAPMLRTVVWTGLVMALASLATLDLLLPGGWLPGDQSLDLARTAAFTVLVLAQLFNAFCTRSDTSSAWHGLFDNRWLWMSVLLGTALQVAVVEWSWLNQAFHTVPLSAKQWVLCLAMASTVLWASELRKWLIRYFSSR